MQSSNSPIPVFGSLNPAIEYKLRPAAYVVITDRQGRIAAVKGNSHYFLPGGGSLPGESPEQTVVREVREELAYDVCIIRQIGKAIQYFYADERHYQMEAVFFAGQFANKVKGTGENELYWLESVHIETDFYHQSHAWAVAQLRISI